MTDSELSIRQSGIEKMMRRALALDETWELGSLHDFFISWEAGHASAGGSMDKARQHFERANELSGGPARVALREPGRVGVRSQRITRRNSRRLLNEALAIDVNKAPDQRLANVISQRRAKWLLGRIDDLFVE